MTRSVPEGYMPITAWCAREGVTVNAIHYYIGGALHARKWCGRWFVHETSTVEVIPETESVPFKSRFRFTNRTPPTTNGES